MDTTETPADGVLEIDLENVDPTPPVTWLGMIEAVRASGTSRTTLQRKLIAGEIPGATKDEEGRWKIPATGLVAARLIGTTPAPEARPPRSVPTAPPAPSVDELVQARHELELERLRRQSAEREARVLAETVESLRDALSSTSRLLPAAPPPPSPADVVVPPGFVVRRRRWYHRQS